MAALRRAFLIGSIGWAALLLAAPIAASQPAPARAWFGFAFLVYSAGSVVCHQLAARSFDLAGAQMPVCARCTGIYLGAGLTALVALARFGTLGRRLEAARPTARQNRALLAAAALPSAVTLLFEWTTGVTPSNLIRAAAGLSLGAAVVVLILDLRPKVN